jgi:hypothetical protein
MICGNCSVTWDDFIHAVTYAVDEASSLHTVGTLHIELSLFSVHAYSIWTAFGQRFAISYCKIDPS